MTQQTTLTLTSPKKLSSLYYKMEKKRLAIMLLAAVFFILFLMPKMSKFDTSASMGTSQVMGGNIGDFYYAQTSSVPLPPSPPPVMNMGAPASMMDNSVGSWGMDGISSASLIPREVVSTDDFGQYDPAAILSGQNYLDPRSQIGYPETLGGVLRNANRQYRSEPMNPRDPVSIFNLSTIPPDIMRPQFDITNDYQ